LKQQLKVRAKRRNKRPLYITTISSFSISEAFGGTEKYKMKAVYIKQNVTESADNQFVVGSLFPLYNVTLRLLYFDCI